MLQSILRARCRTAPAAIAGSSRCRWPCSPAAGCGGRDSGDGQTGDAAKSGSTVPASFDVQGSASRQWPRADTLDPQLARAEGAFNILRDVFEGLTAIGPDGAPVPAAAESRTVTPDGLEYRFTLREGLRWSNGEAPRAADYVAGMQRLVDPKTASPYAQFIDPVLHANAITRGQKQPGELGVTAPDDRTVLIRLATPAPNLLACCRNRDVSRARPVAGCARGRVRASWQTGVERRLRACGALGYRFARRPAPESALLERRRDEARRSPFRASRGRGRRAAAVPCR